MVILKVCVYAGEAPAMRTQCRYDSRGPATCRAGFWARSGPCSSRGSGVARQRPCPRVATSISTRPVNSARRCCSAELASSSSWKPSIASVAQELYSDLAMHKLQRPTQEKNAPPGSVPTRTPLTTEGSLRSVLRSRGARTTGATGPPSIWSRRTTSDRNRSDTALPRSLLSLLEAAGAAAE